MKIDINSEYCDELSKIGELVLDLLEAQKFDQLSQEFVYATAFGRDRALEIDISTACQEASIDTVSQKNLSREIIVKRLERNTSNLEAIVECYLIESSSGKYLLVELVLVGDTVSIEDVSAGA